MDAAPVTTTRVVIDLSAWAVVFATLLGPILAVQAQKAIEHARERRGRKSYVFHQLMATRAARVSAEHVQGLNSIDLAFYGRKILGVHRRSKGEEAALAAWKEYHDHLSTPAEPDTQRIWNVRSEELFINLLATMAADVGYVFDRVELKKGAYSPIAHGQIEDEQTKIRHGVLSVLSGETPLKMEVTSFPADEDFAAKQLAVNTALTDALQGRGSLTVQVKPSEGDNI
ncbi:MAG TPA: DUF6680 family protein [Steroidobacteraceae bacterium]|nr:DUF6680 family protein [Steroidobacteraceae bacterium]